jgi:hypothetical protein
MMKPEPISDHENLATRPVTGVRGARARGMLGHSRLRSRSHGDRRRERSSFGPRKSLTTVVAERTKQAGASCIVTRSVPNSYSQRSFTHLSFDRSAHGKWHDRRVDRPSTSGKQKPAASCIRTPTYIYTEGCAHTVLYAYVRRTPRTYNSFTWKQSQLGLRRAKPGLVDRIDRLSSTWCYTDY